MLLLDPLCICLLAAAVICVLSQRECGDNYTFNKSWERNWCLEGCFYDDDLEKCRRCSPCSPPFRLNPDGPVLQCQVDGSDYLCAPAEMTFSSVVQDNRTLPLLVLASFFVNFVLCSLSICLTYKCYKRTYWLRKVKKTDRYRDGGRLNRTEVFLMYLWISDKIQKLSNLLKIPLRDTQQGGVKYSKDEICYRYLINLTEANASNCDITMIAKALCELGFGELVYKIYSNTYFEDIGDDTEQGVMEPADLHNMILNLCDVLHKLQDYLRHQFVIAIELGVDLTEIDNCRSQVCIGSKEAIQGIFFKWKETHPSDYTFEHLRRVFKRAHVPQALLNKAATHV